MHCAGDASRPPLELLFFYRAENTHKPLHFATRAAQGDSCLEFCALPHHSTINQRNGELSCHPHRNCTHRAPGKGFQLPHLIKSEKLPNSDSARMANSKDFNGVYYIMLHKNKPVVFTSACCKRGMCNALRNEAGAGTALWTGLFND